MVRFPPLVRYLVGDMKIKKTRTPAQIAASRANGAKSKGPRDTSRTRYNNLQHGYYAKTDFLPTTNPFAIRDALAPLIADFQPANPAELACLERVAQAEVRHFDCLRHEKSLFEKALAAGESNLGRIERHLHQHGPQLELTRRLRSRAGRASCSAIRDFFELRDSTTYQGPK